MLQKRGSSFAMALAVLGLAAGATAQAADSCAALTARLVFQANGTVTDRATGLTWFRCNLGQDWVGGVCTGTSARLDYASSQDLLASSGLQAQGYRLPKLSELLAITASDCGEPAVTRGWQASVSGFYWTASEAFGGFQNTVLMTNGEEYPMSLTATAWTLVVK
ncbi:DUF1566 domain-containing protein [Reinekea sp.]|uniref:Lcl domain-containing protein n=1 Tax=Reinekea sp. TaxID=1970455 RepID=UPI002A7F788C|nr:DUF1566 domain-containing protein [Reinekea sp.]